MATVEHHQITTRMNLDELRQLLDTMTPPPQQQVTSRVSIADIEAAVAAEARAASRSEAAAAPQPEARAASQPEARAASQAESPVEARPRRKYARPFSQVAALLPPTQPVRRPRATCPPTTTGTLKPVRSLAVPGSENTRTISEICACVEASEAPAVSPGIEVVHVTPPAMPLVVAEAPAPAPADAAAVESLRARWQHAALVAVAALVLMLLSFLIVR